MPLTAVCHPTCICFPVRGIGPVIALYAPILMLVAVTPGSAACEQTPLPRRTSTIVATPRQRPRPVSCRMSVLLPVAIELPGPPAHADERTRPGRESPAALRADPVTTRQAGTGGALLTILL